MINKSRTLASAVILAAWALIVVALSADAQDPVKDSAADGTLTLTVGGKIFRLTHAYAQREDDIEGLRLHGPQKSVTVLLSDAPVKPEEVTDWFHLTQQARAGTLHAVALNIDPATKELFGVTIFYVASSQAASPPNISLSGTGLNHRITGLTLSTDTVSGTAEMKDPETWMEIPDATPPKKYRYHARFKAVVRPPTPITATLTGKAAAAGPQVTVALSYFKALRAADIKTAQRYMLPNAGMETFYKKAGASKFREMAKSMTPDPARFAKSVKKVIVRGDRMANILYGKGESLRVVRGDNGAWKAAP